MYYQIRVELRGAGPIDYERLHTAMAQRGFGRDIIGSDGRRYRLPMAEYVVNTNSNPVAIRDLAATAAAETGLQYSVLVGDATTLAWVGLAQSEH